MPSAPWALWLMAQREVAVVNDDRLDQVEYGLWALCRLPPGELIVVLRLMQWIVQGPEVCWRGNHFIDAFDARMFFLNALEEILAYDRRLPAGGLDLLPPPGGYRRPGNWLIGNHRGSFAYYESKGMGKGASPMTGKGRGKGGNLPVAGKGRGRGHPRGSRSRSRSR